MSAGGEPILVDGGDADRADRAMMAMATRAALRGFGSVEPNPLVGCVIARRVERSWRVLGIGHHRVFGGAHAESEAIKACAAAGEPTLGATAWVTLEPCAHHGKQPPCADALARAGIAEVVVARADPNPIAAGGADALARLGVRVRSGAAYAPAVRLADPFIKRMKTGLPWVIVKWAQTMDGRVATRAGDSKWVSGARSRRLVHRVRAGVDVILTGVGTVAADDPLLTARDVRRVRRVARRVVVDPTLRAPDGAALLRSLEAAPLTFAVEEALTARPTVRVRQLRGAGVEVVGLPLADGPEDGLRLRPLLEHLVSEHGAATVLVEAGPTLVGALLAEDLIDEVHSYTAPLMLGDGEALSPAAGRVAPRVADGVRFARLLTKRTGRDLLVVYRRDQGASSEGNSAPG